MGQFLKYILAEILESALAIAAFQLTQKVKDILTSMASSEVESDVAVFELLASRVYSIYGLAGLKSLYEFNLLPDFILMAYIIRDKFAFGYPAAAYISDSQPSLTTSVEDLTSDVKAYKRVVTFLDSRQYIDYNIQQQVLKEATGMFPLNNLLGK